jgi:tripartite-type tricarboxylate transporter receptor subunit TctC
MTLSRRNFLATTAAGAAALAMPAIARAQLPRNVRMVIGSTSTGGDTYQNSSIVADALAEQLGINIRVDPVGTNEALIATNRDSRGTTIMLHHDQIYLSHLYGVPGIDDPFANFNIGSTVAINPGNAFLSKKGSALNSMKAIFDAAAAGERVRVAIQPGGVSEIGFTAMKNAARVMNPGSEANLVAVNTGSQADKNQSMWDGLSDVINGSVQANEQFTQLPADDRTAMEFVWITARNETLAQAPEAGYGDTDREALMQFASPKTSVTLDGAQDWEFDKEFFLLYNKEMDQGLANEIDAALAAIYAAGNIQQTQTSRFFIPNYLEQGAAADHLMNKRATVAKMIEQLKG